MQQKWAPLEVSTQYILSSISAVSRMPFCPDVCMQETIKGQACPSSQSCLRIEIRNHCHPEIDPNGETLNAVLGKDT